jgi:hypothetical protein
MSMTRFCCTLVASISIGLASAALADDPSVKPENQTAVGPRAQVAPVAPSADWRYRKFNGQWWYFLPNNQWARWDGRRWTIPTPKSSDYQEWRNQQFAGRFNDSTAQDDAMRRREVDRWRTQAGKPAATSLSQNDTDYRASVDRFHDNLMITPYDYRIGTAGHGLFDANPDRTIANSGRLNYATSSGGYMGSALRSPFGY